jgi:hypothetical protein
MKKTDSKKKLWPLGLFFRTHFRTQLSPPTFAPNTIICLVFKKRKIHPSHPTRSSVFWFFKKTRKITLRTQHDHHFSDFSFFWKIEKIGKIDDRVGCEGWISRFLKTKLMIVLGAKVGGESWVRKLSAEVGVKKKSPKRHCRFRTHPQYPPTVPPHSTPPPYPPTMRTTVRTHRTWPPYLPTFFAPPYFSHRTWPTNTAPPYLLGWLRHSQILGDGTNPKRTVGPYLWVKYGGQVRWVRTVVRIVGGG